MVAFIHQNGTGGKFIYGEVGLTGWSFSSMQALASGLNRGLDFVCTAGWRTDPVVLDYAKDGVNVEEQQRLFWGSRNGEMSEVPLLITGSPQLTTIQLGSECQL